LETGENPKRTGPSKTKDERERAKKTNWGEKNPHKKKNTRSRGWGAAKKKKESKLLGKSRLGGKERERGRGMRWLGKKKKGSAGKGKDGGKLTGDKRKGEDIEHGGKSGETESNNGLRKGVERPKRKRGEICTLRGRGKVKDVVGFYVKTGGDQFGVKGGTTTW